MCLAVAICSAIFLAAQPILGWDFVGSSSNVSDENNELKKVAFKTDASIVWSETYGWVTTKPIENFVVGDRALAQNPEVSDDERTSWQEPEWDQWVKLTLIMPKPDGSDLKISLLRPETWVLDQVRYHVGEKQKEKPVPNSQNSFQANSSNSLTQFELNDEAKNHNRFDSVSDPSEEKKPSANHPMDSNGSSHIGSVPLSPLRPIFREVLLTSSYLDQKAQQNNQELIGLSIKMDLPELGLTGNAVLTNIEPAPAIKPGAGRVVTATFHHSSGDVIDLTVGNKKSNSNTETIGTTSNHPFWSVDRQTYIQAGDLKNGETLKSFKDSGDQKVVISQLPRPGPTPVYNLEVHGEHVYYVGQNGILVHNNYIQRKKKLTDFGYTDTQADRILRKAGLGDPSLVALKKNSKRIRKKKSEVISTFELPHTYRSAAGVEGTFSDGGHTFRIDTNRVSAGEGFFHVHIYDDFGVERAVVQGNRTWRKAHRGRVLDGPHEIPKLLRTDINRLIRNARSAFAKE